MAGSEAAKKAYFLLVLVCACVDCTGSPASTRATRHTRMNARRAGCFTFGNLGNIKPRLVLRLRICCGLALGSSAYIENIAVLDVVLFAFQPHLAQFLDLDKVSRRDQIGVGGHFGADKAPAQIGMDRPG